MFRMDADDRVRRRRVLREHIDDGLVSVTSPNGRLKPIAVRVARKEIHGQRTDKARDKEIRGPLVEFVRRPDLLHATAAHHHDASPSVMASV